MALKLFVAALLLAGSFVANAASYTYPGTEVKATATLTQTGTGIPNCSPGTEQITGFINVNSTYNKNYFYWAFGPRSNRTDAPVILWMTGGPGCSSTLAALIENGPCHIDMTTGAQVNNPYGWNNDAYLIYIDQPAGVGFSTSDAAGYDNNEAEVSEDMYWFLQDFFAANPNFIGNNNDFFIVGESYGGHFAPATAHKVFERNQQSSTNPAYTYLPLTGLAVGNGLTAPYIQYKYYPELAYDWCIKILGYPCVSQAQAQQMNASIPSCMSAIDACMQNADDFNCGLASTICNNAMLAPYENTGLNVYDIRKPCIGDLCYDMTQIINFMNLPQTQADFGVPQQSWTPCSMTVNQAFTDDWWQRFDGYVADMLNGAGAAGTKPLRVMIYAGDMDFICNWIGNKAWTLNLEWTQKAQFNVAADLPFSLSAGSSPVATIRSIPGATGPIQFTFAQVYNAGHMVPMDQPAAIYSLLDRFVNNKGWS
eukprot:GILI01001568.1.p1 GENE.GILI01001568.1~~GILI01001568.1.p1  ORF type:complete len:481 (+),score=142.23 GILI01001568.1:42-1484(+)